MVNYLCLSTRHGFVYGRYDNERFPHRTPRRQMLNRWDKLNCMEWVPYNGGTLPSNAVECPQLHVPSKFSRSRPRLYLCRAEHEGSITPGFFNPSNKLCHIAWGGKEHCKKTCEILCTAGEFVPCNDKVLTLATPSGLSEQGEPLYIGRVNVAGEWEYGKVQRSHEVCYVPLKKKETNHKQYEVFIKAHS